MKSLFTRFFGPSRPLSPTPSPPDEEIPRYPPFAKGLPAASVDRILATQAELIEALRHTLALPDAEFRSILRPVLERYAAFTHLLPASETHHHRGAGGLFRHGLEVAHWAALASEGIVFGIGSSPRDRKDLEPRWRLGVGLAGLLHDIGKPVSDLSILDREGKTQWNPYLENLSDWAEQNRIDRYFLRWRDQRHRRHEQFSVLVSERVLTPGCLSYLTASGPDILQAMLEAIAGIDRGGILAGLVGEADRKSVERDLRANPVPGEASLGVPVEKYLLDAMRRLIREGRWTVNRPGARVWRFEEGLHVVWKAAAGDIGELLAKDRIPGIPRDPDTLADILLERGLAIARTLSDGRAYRYWRMVPAALDLPLYMLRLAAPELIFSGEPPLVVDGRLLDDSEAEEGNRSRTDELLAENTERTGAGTEPTEVAAVSPVPMPDHSLLSEPATPSRKSRLKRPAPAASDPGPPSTATNADAGTNSPSHSSPDGIPAGEPSLPVEPDSEPGEASPSRPDPVRVEAEVWLESKGKAGESILDVIQWINSDLNSGVRLTAGRVFLPHPATAQRLGREPREFLAVLDEAGWIETEVLAPLRKVREIDSVRGLVLNAEVSRAVLALAGENDFEGKADIAEATQPIGKSPAPTRRRPQASRKAEKPPTVPETLPSAAATSAASTPSAPEATTPPGSAEDLIALIRSGENLPFPVIHEDAWLSVPIAILDWYVQSRPGLNRARLLVDLHRNPECQVVGKIALKVRRETGEAER